ncbi:MAG: hypothetical protein JETCAE01_23340 [Anaerolineaceae bacterium]|nr:MAG: hypothetical protein JETCAE01_23340 [Anaerolineaceae bacterium]
MANSSIPARRWLYAALILVIAGQACTISLFNPPGNPATATPERIIATNTPYPAAQVTFVVTIPQALQPGETIAVLVLDEVTGLPLRPTQYTLSPRDATTYSGAIPVMVNSVIKYRYVRVIGSTQIAEDTTYGGAIRYRLHNVATSTEVQDIVADWTDKITGRPASSILGQIYNADSRSPIPNILVTAGGIQFITDSQGRFELTGLPIGVHQLVAYSMDGLYLPFQQGARVEEGKATLVDLYMTPTRLVNVTFRVSVPEDTVPGVPVRIAGNILQLGNTFADLQGGVNVVTDRMPIMALQSDGRYTYTLGLPVGAHIQYKYTLGDGYWNAEHDAQGKWVLRDFIVPAEDVTLDDHVQTWLVSKESGPILFEVSIPAVTPVADIIYIQFNIFGWTEPIPMWPLGIVSGSTRWAYQLYSPLNFYGSFSYRYCRNGQCGSADDNQTVGISPAGRQTTTSLLGQDLVDSVNSWKWFENPETLPLVGSAITPRAVGFVAGVEYQSTFRPNFSYYAWQTFANTKAIGANLAVLTPSWSVSSISPLRFATQPGQDPLWIDTAIMVSQARDNGLNPVLFPTPHFPPSTDTSVSASTQFWRNAPRDASWWQSWFTRYRAFLVNYADLAAQSGAQSIILGGEWVTPSLPGGLLPDGTPSNVPADAEAQWRGIIAEVRNHFKGQVLWALPYDKSTIMSPVNFLRDVDGIYLLWSVPIATSSTATKTDYVNEAGRLLDNEIAPLVSLLGNKPVIIAASYPAAGDAASGCVANGAGGCLDFTALSRPNADIPSVPLSLQAQADIYEALLSAVNVRPWVSGFVSRGYFMPVALQDKSTSINSKPAANVLWYWYPRMLGVIR